MSISIAIAALVHEFRDYQTDGVKSSGESNPSTVAIRAAVADLGASLTDLESRVISIESALP